MGLQLSKKGCYQQTVVVYTFQSQSSMCILQWNANPSKLVLICVSLTSKTFNCINWNLLWVCWRVILADLLSGIVGLAGWGNDRQNTNWSTMEESLIKNTQHTLRFHLNRWQWRLSAARPPPPDSSSQTGLLLSPSQVCSSGTLGSYKSERHRFPMDWKENKQQYLCIIHTWNSSTCCAVTLNFLLELFGKAGCKKHGIHLSETNYFVCGMCMSWCLLIQRTSKHLGHNSSAHFSGQAINHACSFGSFQLAQRTSRVKSWTRKTEDSFAHWTSASHLFFSCPVKFILNFSMGWQIPFGQNIIN